MHPNHQHFLVIRAVEDADPAALGKAARRAPEEIVIELFRAGLFETENLATLWIDARHDVTNGAIFARAVHALEDQQQRIAMRCVVKLLLRAQLLNVLVEKLLILLLRLGIGLDLRRPLAEVDLFVWWHAKIR